MDDDLHKILISRQPLSELLRKRKKAQRRAIWTREDVDHVERDALYLHRKLRWQQECKLP